MSRSYPIWNDIKSCSYKSGKSYGVKATGEVDVLVGSSATHSELFLTHCTTVRENGIYKVFKFSVDGEVLKEKYFNTKTKEFTNTKPTDFEV